MFRQLSDIWQTFLSKHRQERGTSCQALHPDDYTRLLSQHINDGVVVQDRAGHILWSNEAYQRISGYSFQEIAGRKPQEFILPADKQMSAQEIAAFHYDSSNAFFKGFEIVQNQRKSGELFWAQLSFGFFQSGNRDRVIVTVRDISEQVAANEALQKTKAKLEKAVNFDPLTGLANRRKLMDFLEQKLLSAARENSYIGVLHFDLDRFKDINDTYGHAAGDAVIQHAAKAMLSHVETSGLAARIGGDEFVMVKPGISEPSEMQRLAEDLITGANKPLRWDGRNLSYGYSIGIAISKPGMTSGQELIQNADFAMYEAKARGRGGWALYDAQLEQKHKCRKRIAEDLKRALRDEELEYYFQPIIDLSTHRVAGLETLARWRHPRKGPIPPKEFLSVAEEVGMLEQVDRAAMKAAARAAKRLCFLGYCDTYVSFNASTHALMDERLVEDMIWTAAELQLDPRLLAVEVLETVFFAPDATATKIAEQIRKMRQAGFISLLDDFGVGYAGLAHLGQLDVNGLKIDRSLVGKIKDSHAEAVIVRAILQLAKDLKITAVVEGVEDAEMVEILMQNGCTLAQGFHLAHPMSLDALEDWLTDFETGGAAPKRA